MHTQVEFVRDFALYLEPACYVFPPAVVAGPSAELQAALRTAPEAQQCGLSLAEYMARQQLLLLSWEAQALQHLPRMLWACCRAVLQQPPPDAAALGRYLTGRLTPAEAASAADVAVAVNRGDWARLVPQCGVVVALTLLRRFLRVAADALIRVEDLPAICKLAPGQLPAKVQHVVCCVSAMLRHTWPATPWVLHWSALLLVPHEGATQMAAEARLGEQLLQLEEAPLPAMALDATVSELVSAAKSAAVETANTHPQTLLVALQEPLPAAPPPAAADHVALAATLALAATKPLTDLEEQLHLKTARAAAGAAGGAGATTAGDATSDQPVSIASADEEGSLSLPEMSVSLERAPEATWLGGTDAASTGDLVVQDHVVELTDYDEDDSDDDDVEEEEEEVNEEEAACNAEETLAHTK